VFYDSKLYHPRGRCYMTYRVEEYMCMAKKGTPGDVDGLFLQLNEQADLPLTKIIDYCVGLVKTDEGIARIKHYLFYGTQMQRNYATLFFARRNDWNPVNRAYARGLIDYKQAYSR
jgi:hypothetical protein